MEQAKGGRDRHHQCEAQVGEERLQWSLTSWEIYPIYL